MGDWGFGREGRRGLILPAGSQVTPNALAQQAILRFNETTGDLETSATGSPFAPIATVASATVLVRSLADLPDPVAGVITLAPSTYYLVQALVDLEGNVLVVQTNTVVEGETSTLHGFLTTAAAALVTSTVGASLQGLLLLNNVGPLFDLSGGQTVLRDLQLSGAAIGTLANTAVFINTCGANNLGQGFVFSGVLTFFDIGDLFFIQGNVAPGFIALDFDASVVLNVGEVTNSIFTTSAPQLSVRIDPGATFTTNFTFMHCTFLGTAPFTSPVEATLKADPQMRFVANVGIADSVIAAGIGYAVATAAGIAVPIAGAGTFVAIGGPYAEDTGNERFITTGTPGELRYIGNESAEMLIIASSSLTVTLGVVEGRIRLARNGSPVANTESGSQLIVGIPFNLTTAASVPVNGGDIIRAEAANITDASDLESVSQRLVITAAGTET